MADIYFAALRSGEQAVSICRRRGEQPEPGWKGAETQSSSS